MSWGGRSHLRLRFLLPLFRLRKLLFGFADCGKVLVQLLPIGLTNSASHSLSAREHRIEHTLPFSQSFDLCCLFLGSALEKHLPKEMRGVGDAGDFHAVRRYGYAATAE
jgi:hypothetical protein